MSRTDDTTIHLVRLLIKTLYTILFVLVSYVAMAGSSSTSNSNIDVAPTTSSPKRHDEFNLYIEIASGTLAGMLSSFTFYPLECIEAKLQVMAGKKKPGMPRSPLDIVRTIVRQEGIAGLYQGVTPTVLGNAVNWGVYFSIYRYSNHWLRTSGMVEVPWMQHSLSAISAGVVTTAIVNPFWVLKIRLATSNRYKGMFDCFQSILKNEGIGGFWKGVGPSFFGVSEGLVQFVTYEQLLNRFRNGNEPIPAITYLMTGATARLVAGLVTYPYQLLRSSMQSEGSKYTSIGDATRSIYKSEGLAGFYRGLVPNLTRSVPPAAMMMYIVEFFRTSLTTVFNPTTTIHS
ncbi:hypothetical protein SAMD00019534_075720 [Acytostelium subglobosum LB1]|uniref:hypothetical protein n=1 Tax=Acytostelium subglobosum LB1 TaxID=1410327 RepID=UPI000644DE75|nr:hypothetical protein SAMD00019534_075720 [Acytostelium subglobosum LB1]GAM24397.1 hypothetical protein SAMD00019534_075720 [Acytostelium subglobosum LB1]|eukprot:XP_012752723.1 hypothetical protein SAMD00019534_075720 [Acytostelium subglobosum LB1]